MTTATPQRADARRNHDRLLDAAAQAFALEGADVSLEQVAREAGVGIGTLYRHFPTRLSLIEAVYRREVATICDSAPAVLASNPPVEALRIWARLFISYAATKRGMSAALKGALGDQSELFAETHRRLSAAVSMLVDAGVAAGQIRSDVDPFTLLRGVGGACAASPDPGWKKNAEAVVDLLVDGMRTR